tara:strand:+ start:383 stop:676 length:294 start_codon:yes stop_codon:yes gene_type:complete
LRIVFTKNVECIDGLKCSLSFSDKLEKLHPSLKRGVNYHTTIQHKKNSHKIWFFAYDKNGKHESERKGEIKIQDSLIVKKYSGDKLTEKEIKNCFKT